MRRKTMMAVAAVVLTCLMAGCVISGLPGIGPGVAGSDRLVEHQFDMQDFRRVSVGHGAEFDIVRSEDYSVIVTVDDNVAPYLDVRMEGDTLYVGLQEGLYSNITLRARVTMPDLYGLEASGGAIGEMRGFSSSHEVDLEASGGSQLSGDLEAGNVRMVASGGSRITLRGSGEDLDANASGGSRVLLSDFSVVDANADVSGGGRAELNVSGRLDANLSGGAVLEYFGNPTLGTINTSGGAEIRRG